MYDNEKEVDVVVVNVDVDVDGLLLVLKKFKTTAED